MPMGKAAVATLVLALGQRAAGAVTRTVSWYSDPACTTKMLDLEFTQSTKDPLCWTAERLNLGEAKGFKVVRNGVVVSSKRFLDADCTQEDQTVIGDDWSQNLPVTDMEGFSMKKECMKTHGGAMSAKISEAMPADGIPDLSVSQDLALSTTAFVNYYPGAGCTVPSGEQMLTFYVERVGTDPTCWKVMWGMHTMYVLQAVNEGSGVAVKGFNEKIDGQDCSSGPPEGTLQTLSLSGAASFVAGGCVDVPAGGSIKALLPSVLSASVVSGGLAGRTASEAAPAAGNRWFAGWFALGLSAATAALAAAADSSSLL